MQRTSILLSLCALSLASACDLGWKRTIINAGQVASVPAAATNTDADVLFIGDATGRMAQADPATGTIQGSMVLWGGVASTPVAITPDGEDSSKVWALHADGFIVNWQAGPSLTQWFWPPPLGGGTRDYCDLDHAGDGDFYVTTVDSGNPTLWRRDGDTNVWSSTVLPGGDGECDRIGHDLFNDRLFLLRDNGWTFERRNPDTLALMSSTILDVDGGYATDIDVFGSAMVAAGSDTPPSGDPPCPAGEDCLPVPAHRMAWTYDATNGNMIDAQSISGGLATSVHITVNAASSTGEMLVSSVAGSPVVPTTGTVRGIQLLDP